jgi:flagellin|tara:strand:+ start:2912 stop:3769 length:858 start_codon:yes stop_codon:yes gene_type:complete
MTVINTNTSATIAANSLARNERAMNDAMERLSTGKRINNAGDDAAGLAISSRMTSQIQGLEQAARNASDAISMIQTADGAFGEITSIMQRMREITVQASSATNSATDITALATEFNGLRDEIASIVTYTEWNSRTLLNGAVDGAGDDIVSFQIGSNAAQTINVDFGTFAMTAGTGNDFGANFQTDLTISTNADSNTAMGYLDTALNAVNTRRASLGAAISRLEHAIDNLSNNAVNTEASRSRILDADYAQESTELARTQIIQQAGTAMLAQANQKSQSVLQLLKG